MAGEVAHQFPASAAKSLVEGYCQDFVSLAASLAQTLEQISMRSLPVEPCRESLARTERGMRQLADAIAEMLQGSGFSTAPKAPVAEVAPVPSAPRPATAAPVAAPSPAKPKPAAAAPPPPRPIDGKLAPRKEQAPANELHGTSQSMPLLSVFQFLSRMRKSGTLHVQIGGEHITFDFVGGAIEFTSSDLCPPSERLGDVLVGMYPALRSRLEPVLEKMGKVAVRKLGALLVQDGLVSNGQLIEALEKQVHTRFHRAITAALASYEFDEGERVPGDGRIRIRPFELAYTSKQLGK